MTKQQLVVYQVVKNSHSHPDVEEIWQQARKQLPELGIATVYRALNRLAEEGSIRRIAVSGSSDRFDGTLAPHAHAFCVVCGRVRDVQLGDIEDMIKTAAGSTDVRVEVTISEVCAECAAKKRVPASDNGIK